MSRRPMPWASYQCNSAWRSSPVSSSTRAVPLELGHRPLPYAFFSFARSRMARPTAMTRTFVMSLLSLSPVTRHSRSRLQCPSNTAFDGLSRYLTMLQPLRRPAILIVRVEGKVSRFRAHDVNVPQEQHTDRDERHEILVLALREQECRALDQRARLPLRT